MVEFDQNDVANEMRRAAAVARDNGFYEIADGNEKIAEYIEGLECAIAAERKLSARRAEERNAARERVKVLEDRVKLFDDVIGSDVGDLLELDISATPAPWSIDLRAKFRIIHENVSIASTGSDSRIDFSEHRANARFIVVACNLLRRLLGVYK